MTNLTRTIDWTVKAACFAILVYFAVIRGPEAVEMVRAQRGLFESKVNSEGIIQSKTRYTVTAFAEGTMRKPNFKVGDEIHQGAVVTEILVGEQYENLRAAVSGVVSKVHHENSAKIVRKDPIIEISDPEHMEMMTELMPAEAEQVHLGDAFTISKWGGSDILKGTITHIAKNESKESSKIAVTGQLQDVPQDIFRKLGSRSQVNVSIQVAKYPDALKLPLAAVFRTKKSWAVFKVEDRRAREKDVTILNRNNEEVMIGEGISEGDVIINQIGSLIKDGVRVEKK